MTAKNSKVRYKTTGPDGSAVVVWLPEYGVFQVRFYLPDGSRHSDGDYEDSDFDDVCRTADRMCGVKKSAAVAPQ